MSATNNSNAASFVPNESERKQIFFWLKQISSYTAWNRLFSFYRAWADAARHIRHLASERDIKHSSLIIKSDSLFILNGLTHCGEGVHRLKVGDKRAFKLNPNGEFAMAERALSYWDKYLWRMEIGEHPRISEENTPGWGQFHSALTSLIQVWREITPDVLERRHPDSHTFCNDFLRATLEQFPFPDPIPAVSEPGISALVRSGRRIPCSGIWEPVHAPKPKLLSVLRQKEPANGPFPITGTMSYLHGGSNAPNMAAYGEMDGLPATWRLLWEDTRYADGSVPDEEELMNF